MKVFISKYAITDGIIEREVVPGSSEDVVRSPGHFHVTFKKPDWHLTYEEAAAQAEIEKQKRIASLEKQLTRLKHLKF
jgi:hypothetical protein